MSKNMLQVIGKTIGPLVAKKFSKDKKITFNQIEKITPHLFAMQTILVDSVKFKKDLTTDVKQLANMGVSAKQIADKLGMSLSYVYKLLKK